MAALWAWLGALFGVLLIGTGCYCGVCALAVLLI